MDMRVPQLPGIQLILSLFICSFYTQGCLKIKGGCHDANHQDYDEGTKSGGKCTTTSQVELSFWGGFLDPAASRILSPQPGIKPRVRAVRAVNLNYWHRQGIPQSSSYHLPSPEPF